MLSRIKSNRPARNSGGHYAVVASRYNSRYVNAMVNAARRCLRSAGVKSIEVVRVPGAFEIPAVAAALARREGSRPDAILCLGVILRGATTHAQHIGEAVTFALAEVQIRGQVPVIHEVLLLENAAQARERCLSRTHNRGTEAAQTALAMVGVMRRVLNVGT
jgi:6,7-dimethyl-8-ribityllumazine synthase